MKILNLVTMKKMKNNRMKTCSISGKRFRANTSNFYANSNTQDGLHPYHKKFDNFRRVNGVSVERVRELVNFINNPY